MSTLAEAHRPIPGSSSKRRVPLVTPPSAPLYYVTPPSGARSRGLFLLSPSENSVLVKKSFIDALTSCCRKPRHDKKKPLLQAAFSPHIVSPPNAPLYYVTPRGGTPRHGVFSSYKFFLHKLNISNILFSEVQR